MQLAVFGRGVSLSYNGQSAVSKSDFDIPAGELTAVIGPNGSGKSTLLNGISGLAKLTSGTIDVFGTTDYEPAQIAYVLQTAKVNESIPVTVAEIVAMGRYAHHGMFGSLTPADRKAVTETLDRLQISDLKDSHLSELSGGQRQRVFVAQGLAQQADLLLLDEPVTALDIVSRELIIESVRAELHHGRTVVFTTHDLAEAGGADYVLLMARKVAGQGTPDDVLTPDLLSSAYGVGIVHLEDGSIVLDDAVHGADRRHVHFERGDSRG